MYLTERARELFVPALVLLLLIVPGRGGAQVPGMPFDDRGPGAESQWNAFARALADSLVADMVTLAETGDAEALARLFTDRGRLVTAGGVRAEGRDSVRALLERFPHGAGLKAQVTRVSAGPRLLHASGRVRYRTASGSETRLFDLLMEPNYGWWQVRALSLAVADEVTARSSMPSTAVRAHDDDVRVPQRMMLRVTVEPAFTRESGTADDPATRWSGYGAAIGLELNRTLELRGFGWTQPEHMDGESLHSFGAELRAFAPELWRIRPFVTLGAAWFDGASAPDTSMVPVLGGGVAVRLSSHVAVQLGLRNYFVASPDGVEPNAWVQEDRTGRPMLSAGLSLAVGRRPEWRDSPPSASEQRYEAEHADELLAVLQELRDALGHDPVPALDSLYTLDASLFADGAVVTDTREMHRVLRRAGLGAMPTIVDLSVSDRIGYVQTVLETGDGARHLLTVLRKHDDRWQILSQVLDSAGP